MHEMLIETTTEKDTSPVDKDVIFQNFNTKKPKKRT